MWVIDSRNQFSAQFSFVRRITSYRLQPGKSIFSAVVPSLLSYIFQGDHTPVAAQVLGKYLGIELEKWRCPTLLRGLTITIMDRT